MCWTDDQYIFSKPTKQRRLQAYFVDTCQSSKCIPGQVHPSHSKLHGLAHELLSRKSGIETWQICNIGIRNVSSIFRSNYATVKTLTCKSRCLFHQKQDFDYIFSKHLHFFCFEFCSIYVCGLPENCYWFDSQRNITHTFAKDAQGHTKVLVFKQKPC